MFVPYFPQSTVLLTHWPHTDIDSHTHTHTHAHTHTHTHTHLARQACELRSRPSLSHTPSNTQHTPTRRYETTTDTPVGEVLDALVGIYNGILRIGRLAREVRSQHRKHNTSHCGATHKLNPTDSRITHLRHTFKRAHSSLSSCCSPADYTHPAKRLLHNSSPPLMFSRSRCFFRSNSSQSLESRNQSRLWGEFISCLYILLVCRQ